MVTAVHKFDFVRIIIKATKYGYLGTAGHAVVHTEVFDLIVFMPKRFVATVFASIESLYPRCSGQMHYLEKETVPA